MDTRIKSSEDILLMMWEFKAQCENLLALA